MQITFLLAWLLLGEAPDVKFDLLIQDGQVVDGSGNPWCRADVGIHRGKIVAVGDLSNAEAANHIDASGKIVAPGFIDLHSHAIAGLLSDEPERWAAPNLVTQGITTVVVNPDGAQSQPTIEQKAELLSRRFGPNVILMIGFNSVRGDVLGKDHRRPASAEEIERMKGMIRDGMHEGAFGLTAGLEYVPAIWSTTDEVAACVAEIVPFGGAFICHERASGADPMWFLPSQHSGPQPGVMENIRELIQIGETTGAKVVQTHIKVRGANVWGMADRVIAEIQSARQRGVRIYADQYPYNTSGSDGRLVLIPQWVFETKSTIREAKDYSQLLKTTLDDPAKSDDLRQDIAHETRRRGSAEHIIVMDHPKQEWMGKSIAEIAAAKGESPVETAIRLQLEGDPSKPGGGRLRSYSMSESDVEAYAKQPWTATSTDAGISLVDQGNVHARFYGSYPRKIRHYAIDRRLMTVEDAIRSATSLPAQILGLKDRGWIREGAVADIVILDRKNLRDKATFESPHQFSEGVDLVLIAGKPIVEHSRVTGSLPGELILRGK